jgi:uncharacterized protein
LAAVADLALRQPSAGRATAASDWDLFVVVPDETSDGDLDPVVAWRLQKGSGVAADVVPCRLAEFTEGRGVPNTLAYEVAEYGMLLYER